MTARSWIRVTGLAVFMVVASTQLGYAQPYCAECHVAAFQCAIGPEFTWEHCADDQGFCYVFGGPCGGSGLGEITGDGTVVVFGDDRQVTSQQHASEGFLGVNLVSFGTTTTEKGMILRGCNGVVTRREYRSDVIARIRERTHSIRI